MSDESAWDRIRKELATPWDWVAAGIGAAGGLGVSASVGGLDGGTSAAIGALASVSARKAGVASMRGKNLERRAVRLREVLLEQARRRYQYYVSFQEEPMDVSDEAAMVEFEAQSGVSEIELIVANLESDLELWRERIVDNDRFEVLLNDHIESFRKTNSSR